MSKSISEIVADATETATKNGFTDSSFVEDLALIHSEVSEALEEYRNGFKPDEFTYSLDVKDAHKPCGIPSELADIVIRVAHLAGKHGIDLGRAVEEKLAFNKTRPFRHNKVI